MTSGVLLVNKEKNYTSRDVVNIVSKKLKTKKVGHTGTLDPMATGLLVLTIGKATKLGEILTSNDKVYIAEATLGIKTDTLDITGNIIDEKNVHIEEEDIKKTLAKMKGKYMQEVPIYSAIKVNGKKLYEYARKNEKVDLPKHEVEIKDITLIENIKYDNGKTVFKFKCHVSKGTYIRSLIRDIAKNLNTIGVMSDLKRINLGKFDINNSISVDLVDENKVIPIIDVLDEYLKIIPDNDLMFKIKNGAIIDNTYNTDKVLFITNDDNPLAIYKIYEKNNTKLKPWKMF